MSQKRKLKTKSILSYYGSDSEVAADLASFFDDCNHVTIGMVGGGSIIPHLKARAIVANDKNELAINFLRVGSGRHGLKAKQRLIQECLKTISHPSEMRRAEKLIKSSSLVAKAWAYWAMCWVGRKGKGGTKNIGGMPSIRRNAGGGTNATRIKAAASSLEAWAEELTRCEWDEKCFRELLPLVKDEDKIGLYLDPPWVKAGARYLHSFSKEDHVDLAKMARRFEKAVVVVRYGDDPLIRELYKGWHIIEAETRDQCNARKGEIWLTNKT